MSNFRSLVKQTMHVQLQRFAHFQTPMLHFAAFVVLSSLPIVGPTASRSVAVLATKFRKATVKLGTLEGAPLLASLFNMFGRAFYTACLQVRIHIKTPIQWGHVFNGYGKPWNDDTYATPRAEATYWRVAGRYRRRLYSGNGSTFTPSTPSAASRDDTLIPLVTYYTPRLLPLYRDRGSDRHTSREADVDARISPKVFCKWHRMVFQGSCHPTLAQAAVQMRYYSNRDLREIRRIAKLLPNEHVFRSKDKGPRRAKRFTKYSDMWRNWLENKGVDIVIVFE